MTSPSALSSRLLELTVQQLAVPADALAPHTLLSDELGVDSLAAIEWGMTIEDEFAIALPEDAWDHVTTYGRLDEMVRRLVGERAGAPAEQG